MRTTTVTQKRKKPNLINMIEQNMNRPYGIIYKIVNKINGKVYIGQTRQSLGERWSKHKYKNSHCRILRMAMKKYGLENFTIEAIASSFDAESLHETEMILIKTFNCIVPNGYNLTDGSNTPTMSDEACKQKSIALKKKYKNSDFKLKMQKVFNDPERVKKISESSKERWANPQYKEKLVSAIKKSQNKEYRQKQRLITKNRMSTVEAKSKKSQESKKMWENEEYREKQKIMRKKMWENEEYRQLQSIHFKKRQKEIIRINKVTGERTEFLCANDAAKDTGLAVTRIRDCISGRRKSSGGYFWLYKSKEDLKC